MEVNYSVSTDANFGKKSAIITIPPTPPNRNSVFITVSEEQIHEFKGPDGNNKFSRIKNIDDKEITAFVDGKVVTLYTNIKKTGGRRKTRKSRKNKSRRYRRV
jgi:hypothetical protein